LATSVLIVLIASTLVPYYLGFFSKAYLIVVTIGVDLFIAFFVVSMWINQKPAHLGRLAVWMKVDMLAGLAAVFVGRTP
jgi:hypothetical protein